MTLCPRSREPVSMDPTAKALVLPRHLVSLRVQGQTNSQEEEIQVVISDESEDFDPVDESEAEVPMEDDDDEYMSEPKSTSKRGAGTKGKATKGGKGKKKPEPKEITARDERKRPIQDSTEPAGAPAAKRARTKPAQKPGADVLPRRKKLPPIKKNKPLTGASAASVPAASGAGTSTPSIPAQTVPLSPEESKLPPPVVGAGARKATLPFSTDVDYPTRRCMPNCSNLWVLYCLCILLGLTGGQGGGSTPSGFTRREKDEERRKELNKMRDEARAKRINEASPVQPPPFDLQGQMDKITRFEEKLRNSRSPAVYPNFIAGGMKALQAGRKCYAGNDLESREEGEM
ncbi:hypothetical protein B0H14DRAFT_2642391 [Mycena olivaceomarginata]|nr:hypothetical protein B0H14DRAFT_2642391 [Mycena olivaceomarginata]